MAKLLVIGIDGLDYDYVAQHLDALKTFRALARRGCLQPLRSTFPPDSIPAWISIFTGRTPAQHGVVDSVDYLQKNYRDFRVNTQAFAGKTFWDAVGAMGRKVCVINPLLAYPVWPVNGCMIAGPVFIDNMNQAHPPELLQRYPGCPSLGGIVDSPDRKSMAAFVQKTHEDAEQLGEFCQRLLTREQWDLGFVSFFTMDRLQHFLWRFCDPEDPTYPGRSQLESAVLDHYIRFDGIVEKLTGCLPPDGEVMVISDHGHGRRCTKTLNLNEFLRRKGYLHHDCGRFPAFSKRYWTERAKNAVIAGLYALGREDLIYALGKHVKNRKELKTGAHVISKGRSLAWVPKFAGTNPFGGITLASDMAPDRYEALRDAIIADLFDLNRSYNQGLFKWIRKRELLQSSGTAFQYPDILFELFPEYGVYWSLFVPLTGRNYFHRRLSGGHKLHGVLASSWKQQKSDPCVCDIYGLILQFFQKAL